MGRFDDFNWKCSFGKKPDLKLLDSPVAVKMFGNLNLMFIGDPKQNG